MKREELYTDIISVLVDETFTDINRPNSSEYDLKGWSLFENTREHYSTSCISLDIYLDKYCTSHTKLKYYRNKSFHRAIINGMTLDFPEKILCLSSLINSNEKYIISDEDSFSDFHCVMGKVFGASSDYAIIVIESDEIIIGCIKKENLNLLIHKLEDDVFNNKSKDKAEYKKVA